jgi:uncharacterized membrane protein
MDHQVRGESTTYAPSAKHGQQRLVGPLGTVVATTAGGAFLGATFGVIGAVIGGAGGFAVGLYTELRSPNR